MRKIAVPLLVTALPILLIVLSMQLGIEIPIPYLILFASVVLSGGMAGQLAGILSGALVSCFAFYSHFIYLGSAAVQLTPPQAFIGGLIVIATGFLIGRTKDQRDSYLSKIEEDAVKLESHVSQLSGQISAVFQHSPMALFIKDPDGTMQAVNQEYLNWTGKTEEELIGKKAHEFLDKQNADSVTEQDRLVVESGRTDTRDYRFRMADGKLHDVVTKKFPIDANNKLIGLGTVMLDITERRQAENQLQQAQKMEAIGQLTGGLAHDFNNLLTIIQSSTELLLLGVGDQTALTKSILRTTERGADLTKRLLSFARRRPLYSQTTDVEQLISEMSDLLQRTLGETIDVSTSITNDLWKIQADSAQLENAILNLALNARDAMPSGGQLRISCSNIVLNSGANGSISNLAQGDYLLLEISDTGIGIPSDKLMRVFEPFYTTKETGGGSGLGLSMVYSFVTGSNGDVVIESNKHGTSVKLYFPRLVSANESQVAIKVNERVEGANQSVLVLEDEPDVLSVVVTLVNNLGYKALGAASVIEARDILSQRNIELMISDIVLPGGTSGMEFAKEIHLKSPDLKIIFMSGFIPDSVIGNAVSQPITLLHKPFSNDELAGAIQDSLVLKNRRGGGQGPSTQGNAGDAHNLTT